jgi:hypothetical protein
MNNINGNNNESGQGKAGPEQSAGGQERLRPEEREGRTPTPAGELENEEGRPKLEGHGPLASREQWISRIWLNIIIIALTLVVCIGITATYQFRLHKRLIAEDIANALAAQQSTEGKVAIRVFYPSPGGLVPEERWVEPSEIQTRVVESAVLEYLKGPSEGAVSYVPEGTRLLGLYHGSDGIIYMDFSHEFRSNFQGDAYGEFLLLRGLYESVMSNARDVSGLKILIEGEEVDTIGGHISLEGTLGSVVSSTMMEGYEGK